MAVTGQFWYLTQGTGADNRISYVNNDGTNHTVFIDNGTPATLTGFPQHVAIDWAAGVYYVLSNGGVSGQNAQLLMGHLNSSAAPTSVFTFPNTDTPQTDVVNTIQINPYTHTLYVGTPTAPATRRPGRAFSTSPTTRRPARSRRLPPTADTSSPRRRRRSSPALRRAPTFSTRATSRSTTRAISCSSPSTPTATVSSRTRSTASTWTIRPRPRWRWWRSRSFPGQQRQQRLRGQQRRHHRRRGRFQHRARLFRYRVGASVSAIRTYTAATNKIYYIDENANGGTAVAVTLNGLPGGNSSTPATCSSMPPTASSMSRPRKSILATVRPTTSSMSSSSAPTATAPR